MSHCPPTVASNSTAPAESLESPALRQPAPAARSFNRALNSPPHRDADRRALTGLLLLVLYATFRALADAASTPLKFDEIFTVSMARLPHLATLFHALWQGADSQPPLFDLIERAAALIPHAE